jgi:hypothetical protein
MEAAAHGLGRVQCCLENQRINIYDHVSINSASNPQRAMLYLTGGRAAHKRELTALPRCPMPASCRCWPFVRACIDSLFQPGTHGGFLTLPPPWTTAEKAGQTGEARLEASLRPPTLYLLSQRLQPQPASQPTTHYDALRGHGGAQQEPQPCRRAFVQGPGNQERPDRRFDPRPVLTAYLVESQQLLHFFQHEFHLPPSPIDI